MMKGNPQPYEMDEPTSSLRVFGWSFVIYIQILTEHVVSIQ